MGKMSAPRAGGTLSGAAPGVCRVDHLSGHQPGLCSRGIVQGNIDPQIANNVPGTCSKHKVCRSEGKLWPDVHNLTAYHDRVAHHPRAQRWDISHGDGHVALSSSASASTLSPGQYRTQRSFPNGKDEFRPTSWVSSRTTIGCEGRTSSRHGDALIGGSTLPDSVGRKPLFGKPNPLGPGQYSVTEGGVIKHAPVMWSFDRSTERDDTQDKVRERKVREANPTGPGQYEASDPLTKAGTIRREESAALPRSRKKCQCPAEFGHIFKVMAPLKSKHLRADYQPSLDLPSVPSWDTVKKGPSGRGGD